MEPSRCAWVNDDPLYVDYHDREWGVESRDEQHLFEMLILEGAQAGLSWYTVLQKRDGYRAAFRSFDVAAVAALSDADLLQLRSDPRIVRNRLKIESARSNARAALGIMEQGPGAFSDLLWSFVGGEPIVNTWRAQAEVPATTAESEAMSKALKRLGFRFVGPTICYAFMQAVGMVNDHLVSCFRHPRHESWS